MKPQDYTRLTQKKKKSCDNLWLKKRMKPRDFTRLTQEKDIEKKDWIAIKFWYRKFRN